MTIRTIIIEDEQPAVQRLVALLKSHSEIEILDSIGSGKEAAELIDTLRPELIFLDVHLSDISGIDVLRLINHQPQVIFTTAYDQYAIQAFELGAADYLLKPFSGERLQEAIQRVAARLQSEKDNQKQLERLLQQWRVPQPYLRRIPCRVGNKIYILNEEDIVYFATENKLVFAHLIDRKYLINYTLEELQSRLDPENFFRIHRSTIVNLNYVKSIEPWFGGGYRGR